MNSRIRDFLRFGEPNRFQYLWKNEGLTVGIAVTCAVVGYLLFYDFSLNDPDRYFHFRIASLLQERWYLPQIENFPFLNWQQRFVDKEFFYHSILSQLHRFGGESAIVCFHFAILAIFVALAGILVRPFLGPVLGPAIAGIFLWSSPYVFTRFSFVRPHNWALVLWAVLLVSLLRRRTWLAAMAGFGFALSYHLFVLPLGVLLLLLSWDIFRERALCKYSLAGIIGIAIGVVINPYFPGNLDWVSTILHIGVSARSTALPLGLELIPLPAMEFIERYWHYLLVFIFGVGLLFLPHSQEHDSKEMLYVLQRYLIIFALFIAGLLWSPRMEEYLLLVAVIVAAVSWRLCRSWVARNRLLMGLLGILVLSRCVTAGFTHATRLQAGAKAAEEAKHIIHDLREIQTLANPEQIFHCNWSLGAYLFYVFPNAKLIDALDPTLLELAQPAIFKLRQEFIAGNISQIHQTLAAEFQASHIVCRVPAEPKRLTNEPGLRRIFPPFSRDRGMQLWTYEVER